MHRTRLLTFNSALILLTIVAILLGGGTSYCRFMLSRHEESWTKEQNALASLYPNSIESDRMMPSYLSPFVTSSTARHFDRVVSLDLRLTSVTDSCLPPLSHFRELRYLDLAENNITDAGLPVIAGFDRLEHLDISATDVSGTRFSDLWRLGALRSVNVMDIQLSDTGWSDLVQLPALVALSWTGATDSQIEQLVTARPQMRHITLDHPRISDRALEDLGQLDGLLTLELSGARVSDVGVQHLLKLRKLKALDLSDTLVTDQGAKSFANLPSLQHLDLSGTSVTKLQKNKLANALPGGEVW